MRIDRPHPAPQDIDPSWKIGIVYSWHYEDETTKLVEGAREFLKKAGIPDENVSIHRVPGAFEIPLIGAALAAGKKVDALIALGIIVEGDTHHAELIATECARGIMDVQTTYRVPFAFEVLYVRKLADAEARAEGSSNKGEEAAVAVLHSLAEMKRLQS